MMMKLVMNFIGFLLVGTFLFMYGQGKQFEGGGGLLVVDTMPVARSVGAMVNSHIEISLAEPIVGVRGMVVGCVIDG